VKTPVLYLLISLIWAPALGQSVDIFTHFSYKRGLTDLRIEDIVQDKPGYMWFATQNGLNRYDGYKMQAYFADGSPGSLPHSFVNKLYTTQRGELVAGTRKGLAFYNYQTNLFDSVQINGTAAATLSRASVTAFAEDSSGNLLAGTYNGLFRLDRASGQWQNLSQWFGEDEKLSNIRGILFINADTAFVVTQDQPFFLLDFKNRKAKIITFNKPFDKPAYHYIRCITRLNRHELLLGFFALGMGRYDIAKGTIMPVKGPLKPDKSTFYNAVYAITRDSENKIWVGSHYFGLAAYHEARNEVTVYDSDPTNPLSYNGGSIGTIFEDRQQNLWIGTLTNGIYLFKPYKKQVIFHPIDYLNPNGYNNGPIRKITEISDDHLYLGADEGFSIYHKKQKTYHNFKGTKSFLTNQPPEGINFTEPDYAGNVWLGSNRLGLCRYNAATGSFKSFGSWDSAELRRVGNVQFYRSLVLPDSSFFFICYNRLVKLHVPTLRFQNHYNNNHPVYKLLGLSGFCTDKNNTVWITQTEGRLYQFNNKTYAFKEVFIQGLKPGTFQFLDVAVNQQGELVLGTEKGVLVTNLNQYRLYSPRQGGTPINDIRGVMPHGNHIWFGNSRLLGRLNTADSTWVVLGTREGLSDAQLNIRSLTRLSNGKWAIGAKSGWYEIDADSLQPADETAMPFITSLKAGNREIALNNGKQFFGSIQLMPNERSFLFSMSSFDYNQLEEVTFAYKLEPLDKDWRLAGKSNEADYANIAGGTYYLKVRARNKGGNWTEGPLDLKIVVAKHFWETWWFILLSLALLAWATYIIYIGRINSIKKVEKLRASYEIKMNELENSALRTQMNPHFIFNSLNTINSFINRNESIKANQYISKFSKLIRLILDHSRQKKILLQDELEVVKLYIQIEQIRFDNHFGYHIEVADELLTDELLIPPLIVQPFVENAILHGLLPLGKGGELRLKLLFQDDMVQCLIEDNGIGRALSAKQKQFSPVRHKSHGMEITLKRIELFNKEHGINKAVEVIDKTTEAHGETGTRVLLHLAKETNF